MFLIENTGDIANMMLGASGALMLFCAGLWLVVGLYSCIKNFLDDI